MTLTQVGSAAGEAALDAGMPRQRGHVVPQRSNADDLLLDAVRRNLTPGDPVARLLAGWLAPPVRPVATHPPRRGPQGPAAPA